MFVVLYTGDACAQLASAGLRLESRRWWHVCAVPPRSCDSDHDCSPEWPPRASVWHETRSVRPKSPRQPAPQRSRLQVVRACRACRAHRCTDREGRGCGGGFPAGGAGRRTVAWLASVSIATSGAVGAAAVAGSSAPQWRGCDHSDRWGRKRRARGERGVGAGAPASLLESLPAQRASPCLFLGWKPFFDIWEAVPGWS